MRIASIRDKKIDDLFDDTIWWVWYKWRYS
jgi:hypothetical protein